MRTELPHITIVTPCYNESIIVIKFLDHLETILGTLAYSFCVVVVNDCSTDDTLHLLRDFQFKAHNIYLNIINLERNVGHQAAIYQGFLYAQTLESNHFIIMDSDGQDSPEAIPDLLKDFDVDIVHVVRSKRKESLLFKVCYKAYKFIFRMVAGRQMNFGNFSLISRNVLERAVTVSFSHFPAFLSKQKCTRRYIVVERAQRIGGQSKMGFKKLLGHAFRSFEEYDGSLQEWLPGKLVQNAKTPIYETIIPGQDLSKSV